MPPSWRNKSVPIFVPNGEVTNIQPGKPVSSSTKPVLLLPAATALYTEGFAPSGAYYKFPKDSADSKTLKVVYSLGLDRREDYSDDAWALLTGCAWSYEAYINAGGRSLFLYNPIPLYAGDQSQKVMVRNPDSGYTPGSGNPLRLPHGDVIDPRDLLRNIWIARKFLTMVLDTINWRFKLEYQDPDPVRTGE